MMILSPLWFLDLVLLQRVFVGGLQRAVTGYQRYHFT